MLVVHKAKERTSGRTELFWLSQVLPSRESLNPRIKVKEALSWDDECRFLSDETGSMDRRVEISSLIKQENLYSHSKKS